MANYTQLTQQELTILLDHFDLGELLKAAPLEGGQANSSIKLSTDKGDFTLSICDEKNREDINNLTDIMVYLEEQKFPTTRLVTTIEGERFVFYRKKPVYVKKFLQGNVIADLSPRMIQEVGQAMAALHQVKPISTMQSCFPYGFEAFDELLDEGFSHQYLDWLAEKKTFLEQAIDFRMKKCFIHGDIFWDNLLFDNGCLVAILDFEEACCYYRLFDLGMAAVGCCSENGCFNFAKIKELLTSYAVINSFTQDEKSQLNLFIEYAAVSASFWRFRQYNIRRPSSENAESYRELSSLADQIHSLTNMDLFD